MKSKWVGHCVHGESHVRIPSPATAVIDAVFRHPREKRNFQIVKVLILLLFYSSTDNKKHGAEGDRETMMGICRKNDNTTTLVKTLCHVSLSHRRMRSRNERIQSTFFCMSSAETLTKSMGRVGYRKLLLVFPCPTRRHPPNSVLIFSYRPRIT